VTINNYAASARLDAEQARAIKQSLKASRDRRIVMAWNDSNTIAEIAKQHGMRPDTVSRILVRAGVHVPQHVQRKGG
jgi:hypothetical protein